MELSPGTLNKYCKHMQIPTLHQAPAMQHILHTHISALEGALQLFQLP